MSLYVRKFIALFIHLFRRILSQRGLIIRSLITLLIGLLMLWVSYQKNFDLRFKLRSTNQPSKNLALIEITPNDLIREYYNHAHFVQNDEFQSLPDSQYWNLHIWESFLEKLLKYEPKAISVTLFFGSNINPQPISPAIPEIFFNKKIIWAARKDQEGRILLPLFSDGYHRNIGLVKINADADGVTRRFESPYLQVPHMSASLASKQQLPTSSSLFNEAKYINFQGPANSYNKISFSQLMRGLISKEEIQNKIIIIGAADNEQHLFQTPLGPMSRAELIANITNNFINEQWIQHWPQSFYFVILLSTLLFSVYIINRYPHAMTFIFLTWFSFSYTAASLWIFDQFFVWIPLMAPLSQNVAAFIIFLSYQLTEKDYQNWKLEQEKVYLFKVEQMKDNFISLFSHDLKTPIAKIQAICDRLIAENPNLPITSDLQLLRVESQELHRYIQSILQVTRVESKDFKIRKDSYDINEMVKEAYDRLETIFASKGQKVELDLEPLFLIEIDGQLVREVIINLLENASKYSPPGSAIKVSTREDAEGVYFKVKDQGPGVDKKEIEKVFEKFYRGQDQMNKTKGSGLGLYLSKYFIELHGGKLNFKSDIGKGTEVSFYLPV